MKGNDGNDILYGSDKGGRATLEYLYGDNSISESDNGISSLGGNDKIYGGSNVNTSILIGGIMDDYIVSGDNTNTLLVFGDYPNQAF